MNNQQQIKRLSNAINQMLKLTEVQQVLEEKKQKAVKLKSYDDFIWRALLISFSTWGRSEGYNGLFDDSFNYKVAQVEYEELKLLMEEERCNSIYIALKNAHIRYASKKALFLTYNYSLIEEMGGVKTVKEQLLSQDGREDKIKFLMWFKGIGPKYSRNIMMDIYHPEFHQTIAVDKRLKNILNELNIPETSYEAGEQFFLDVAKECHVDGWTIDRILYHFTDDVLMILRNIV